LIDSWSWIEYWAGSKYADAAAVYIDGSETAVVSTINLAEVRYWFIKYYDERIADERVARIQKRCFAIPVSDSIAIEASKIKHDKKMGLADSIILATAYAEGAKVVTGDPDFAKVDGVVFIG
jgi:predicted nucleic acid-binding protein